MTRALRRQANRNGTGRGLDRRTLLVGAGAAGSLLLAWGAWPRTYRPNLNAAAGETVFNAFLKIDKAGRILVIVPQAETGQGVTTLLPQILADELGADWRTVGVQSAPVSPLYANTLLAREWLADDWSRLAGGAGEWAIGQYATRRALMLTGAGTSVPMFHTAYQEAGAAARVLLCKAAAARWDVPWESCDIQNGIITDGGRRTLKIGEVAAEAAELDLPDILPFRQGQADGLFGQDLPRLDTPSKIDGSHNFAADVRLPDMLFASIRQGPIGNALLTRVNEQAAKSVTGFSKLVRTDRWVAAVATNWWAANKALDLSDPVFELSGSPVSSAGIDAALEQAFSGSSGQRLYSRGDLKPLFDNATILASEFSVAPGLHLTLEPPCATARVGEGVAEIWMPAQAPALARTAIADALDMPEEQVVLYPLHAGGSFGRKMDFEVGVQAALIAREVGRPVQLLWSRLEDVIQDRPGAPAHARMAAKLGRNGAIEGWLAKVAAPCAMTQTWKRIADGKSPHEASRAAVDASTRLAVAGMELPYAMPNWAVDHFPADVGLPLGFTRGNAHLYGAFFTESFIDELAHLAGMEALSFRIQMLGGNPRLAHCLTTVGAMGGWQGGIEGSGQGLAVHAINGAYIAVMVEAAIDGNKLNVGRIIAAVDGGEQVNPDIARQQVESGLLFGLAVAMGASVPYAKGMPTRSILSRMGLPRLQDIGEITVEMIRSTAPPAGLTDIGAPPVAPAIANALFTVTGQRFRQLPILSRT
ncbi:xanthine dehydrogenase family protein molybdopterin-binding subunit [Sphingomonadales bacterium 56]|uniref:xanthine dehydrogenase family protein molybdopterin-binding subunit n=1 Tax=unclassified Sphingobium TaxID=2611147 RepID=UPI001917D176|nr:MULTISPECIES: molybdopterin cofactor-binding domain-containing protein [unclassified Sphingobium]MBY2929170.1 xanthine dehydrogenase family protein molybdopterin-binding subunit [Sphingomonadales bacterium 56]MBY2958918.1 xanthine dehydrogenase family protein molybdopterin-binding subunit [Sphingomonadales bacterium 58]CAD7338052.1 Isoquinoline 1-oxidoreductase subunit beta [Sphingobium sp. S8]CAD7338936.1 Isoquinoline 1-oxidoreductase subunit beta [Sphingobium sp. S6]